MPAHDQAPPKRLVGQDQDADLASRSLTHTISSRHMDSLSAFGIFGPRARDSGNRQVVTTYRGGAGGLPAAARFPTRHLTRLGPGLPVAESDGEDGGVPAARPDPPIA